MKKLSSRNPHGFSLIEMLLVLAIMALIAGMMVGVGEGIYNRVQERTTREFVKSGLKTSLLDYKLDMGSYPTTEQGLRALLAAPPGVSLRWNGPYIEDWPVDGWGRDYQYRFPGEEKIGSYDLFSLGGDGVESEDDIGNW